MLRGACKQYGRAIIVGLLGWFCCLPALAWARQTTPTNHPRGNDEALQQVAVKADELLRAELQGNWYPRSLRPEGGFYQNFGSDWQRLPDPEFSIVAQARHLWTTSQFARYAPEHREQYTAHAKHGFAFLQSAFLDAQHGGLFWSVESMQVPTQASRGIKHVYGIAFAIYASIAYYELTEDRSALAFASSSFDWLEKHAHDPKNGGYHEQLDRMGVPIPMPDSQTERWQRMDPLGGYFGYKSMNSHIHLLEAFSELARFDKRPIVRERLQETLHLVRDRIAVEPGVLCLFFTPDWRATAAHDSFGHDIETAYLLIEADLVLHKKVEDRTWKVAQQLVDHALDWGWDDEHGGFYDKGEAFAEALDTDKVWWVQAEGLNVLAVLHEHFGGETDRYRKAFLKQWNFIERHAIDREHGGWYQETDRAGVPKGNPEKSTVWKCSYHTSRALMNVHRLFSP
jgi:cellobiose epimerase